MMVRCTTLVLGILFLVTGCTSQQQCNNVLQRLQSLSEAVQVMCGSSTTPPPATGHQQQCDCSYPVTWTSVQKTDIGSNNLQHAGTLTYTIPSVIPALLGRYWSWLAYTVVGVLKVQPRTSRFTHYKALNITRSTSTCIPIVTVRSTLTVITCGFL